MSEAVNDDVSSEEKAPAPLRMPGVADTESEGEIPSAYDMPLEDIIPARPRLFAENRWQEYFERLRKEDPVHFNETEIAGRFWSLTRYADIKKVDSDWHNFSSANGITLGFPVDAPPPEGMLQIKMFIAQDPPVHDVQRKTVVGVVAPNNLAKLEPLIRERTCKVLDSLPEGEAFDWVDNVSIELTTMMLATLFDFPFEERRKLTRWSDVATAVPQPGGIIETMDQRREELIECLEYFTRLWEERKQNPGDDLVSILAHGKDTKDMQPMEFLGNLILLIVGGNDTTRNTMSASVFELDRNPDEYAKLKADPSLIPSMVSETIRFQTPLAHIRRTAKVDTELQGQKIKAGDKVIMWYWSGNRDERHFDRPNDYIIDRDQVRSHLAFGFVIHRCMGNRLAELQLRVLWEEVMKRFDRIEVVGEPERTLSVFVNGYTALPVILHPKS